MLKVKVDSHMHSLASGHAYSTINEIFAQAANQGMEAVAITDHAPKMPGASHEMHFRNFECIPESIHGVRFLSGVELSILSRAGDVDMPDSLLKRLKVVIASLHSICYAPESEAATTEALLSVMNNPHIRIVGHLGDPSFPFNIEKVVAHAAKTGTAIEINETAVNATGTRSRWYDTVKRIIGECVKQGAYISAGCDGHFCNVTGVFPGTEALLRELDVPERLFVCRSYDAFSRFIEEKKTVGAL